MALRRPRRLDDHPYLGPYRYLLTFCTSGRRAVFVTAEAATLVIAQFQRTSSDEGFALLAYCLMLDHAHLLVEGLREDSDVRRFAKMAKQRSEYAVRRGLRVYPLWQEGYHDWVLRSDQEPGAVIRYIIENPVRAGLVERWDDYRYSGTLYPLV